MNIHKLLAKKPSELSVDELHFIIKHKEEEAVKAAEAERARLEEEKRIQEEANKSKEIIEHRVTLLEELQNSYKEKADASQGEKVMIMKMLMREYNKSIETEDLERWRSMLDHYQTTEGR